MCAFAPHFSNDPRATGPCVPKLLLDMPGSDLVYVTTKLLNRIGVLSFHSLSICVNGGIEYDNASLIRQSELAYSAEASLREFVRGLRSSS